MASLVQAEGKTHDDFRKMAEVVYNRLKPAKPETRRLEFDSTYQLPAGPEQDQHWQCGPDATRYNDPYNTYNIQGPAAGPDRQPGRER